MTEKKKTGAALALLLIVGAAAFGFGINWGLPSKNADKYFFGGGTAASKDARNSYERSGTGITHLAGNWEDDANRGADVAIHAEMDRSRPVTLVNNLDSLTKDQILENGDVELKHLVSRENQAYQAIGNPNGRDPDDLHRAYFEADGEVNKYVQEYNVKHIPDYVKNTHDDSVNRARIVRRYRLYSDQPDEMITFRALARMHPRKLDLDPKLYQYGGLWIYPIGAALEIGGITHLLTVLPDVKGYLDDPSLFAPFYMVIRAYSSLWGLVAVIAVFFLIRRFTGGWILPVVGGLCFIFMPVVLNMAHEAKPHLAGVALILLAVLAAVKYIETGKMRWVVYTGLACGAAAGMVLSGLCALIVIPLMAGLRKDKPGRFAGVCALGAGVAAALYFASNPYVAIHLIHSGQPNALTSNMENSKAMYQRGPVGDSIVNAVRLIAAGASVPLALAGVVGIVAFLLAKRRPVQTESPWNGSCKTAWLLAAVAVVVLIEFTLYAAGKPGEYARFGAVIDVVLMIAAVAAIGRLKQAGARAAIGAVLVVVVGIFGFPYLLGFEKDTGPNSPRIVAANQINDLLKNYGKGARPVLGIYADPAPFDLPPVDLYRWRIVLLPPVDHNPEQELAGNSVWKYPPDVIVKPMNQINVFNPSDTAISWANTEFEIKKVK